MTEKWYKPSSEDTGWKKTLPMNTRRKVMLKAHKGNALSAARSLQALANVTTDKETRRTAESDAKYLFRQHRQLKREKGKK